MTKPAAQAMPAHRRRELVRVVETTGHATVAELASRFEVSLDTIRRDLDELASAGLITRARGGALSSPHGPNSDVPVTTRTDQSSDAKFRIALATVRLLSDEQTIFLNGGTTSVAVAAQLSERANLTVITSNLLVPSVLDARRLREVYLIGGSVRLNAAVTVGPLVFPATRDSVAQAINADVAVIGVGGVNSTAGYSVTNIQEAEMTRSMLEQATRRIIVCDSSKFERFVFAPVGPLGVADILVTDELPEAQLLNDLRGAGVEVVVAD